MKQLLLIATFLVVSISNAQKKKTNIDEDFNKYIRIADSINYKSDSLNYKLDVLKLIDYYRDKLLLNDNYKKTDKAADIFYSFNDLVGKQFDYSKIVKDESTINNFFQLQKKIFKAKINIEIADYYYKMRLENISDMISKEQTIINNREDDIIQKLHSAKYPIEKFNKLSNEEKDKLLENISKGYKYE